MAETIVEPTGAKAELHFVLETGTLTERLTRLKERASDFTEPLDEFGKWFRNEMKEQFESEGDLLGGGHWAPLSPQYAAYKAKKYGGDKKILERTGKLKASFTEVDTEGNVNRVLAHEGEWGSDLYYAGFHQHGTHKMPARPELSEHTDLLVPRLAKYLGAWLMGEESEGSSETV